MDDPRTVRLGTLVSLIVGSCVGAGIFAMPQNIASVASPGAALIGWYHRHRHALHRIRLPSAGRSQTAPRFRCVRLRTRRAGRLRWLRLRLGLLAGHDHRPGRLCHVVLQLLRFLRSLFDGSRPFIQAVFVSGLTWTIFAVLSRGVRQAAIMNVVATVAKILPILAFLVLVAFVGFNTQVFTSDFWGQAATFGDNQNEVSLTDQVKGMMLFTVWAFIGVEGASTYSSAPP